MITVQACVESCVGIILVAILFANMQSLTSYTAAECPVF
jgi:hypothetical protein